jgi:hypothetical protein
MADCDNDNLVGAHPIIDSIGKSKDAPDPNISTPDARCFRLLGDTLSSTTYLLKQSDF